MQCVVLIDDCAHYACSKEPPADHLHSILHRWTLSDGLLLLKVIKNNGGRGAENETRGTTIEYLVSLYRWLDGFHDRIGQVLDFN